MKNVFFLAFGLLLASVGWANAGTYDYPFTDPYVATVVGTPTKYRPPLPEKIRIKTLELTVFKEREIPDVFWYQDKLRYSLAYQKESAPLIFVIAGTGASYNSTKMQLLQKAFFNAGFHVLSMSSPTNPNFIVTASTTGVPGDIIKDSRDLYRSMGLAWQQVQDRIEVTDFHLTGYSLGGAQAAFIAQLDEDRHVFDFKKVLMINPPVSLYNSVMILDDMLADNIPGGLDHFDNFFEQIMGKFSEIYKTMGYLDFNDDFFYAVHKRRPPKEANLAALIGISFRMSSADMVFTSDVMTNAGFIVPPNLVLSAYESLTDYFKVTVRTSFIDYFNELFYPYFKSQQPYLTKQALIDRVSLRSIEDYLRTAEKIAVVTNQDDLILMPGEVAFFRQVFDSRAKIYSKGGHCGNMAFRDNVDHMISFFKN